MTTCNNTLTNCINGNPSTCKQVLECQAEIIIRQGQESRQHKLLKGFDAASMGFPAEWDLETGLNNGIPNTDA